MANKQTFPQSIYPISGDVLSSDGNPNVTVVAIQNEPWSTDIPQTGQIPVQGADGVWHPEDPVVSGPDAPGDPSTANPVQIAGIDDGTRVREVRTDSYGSIQLSMFDRTLLLGILNQLKALTRAIVDLDKTAQDPDYVADRFDNVDPMQQ